MASVLASHLARYAAVALCLVLAACTSDKDKGPSLSLSTNNVTFRATQNGDTPPSQQVTVAASDGSVFVGMDASALFSANVTASFQLTGGASGVITFTPLGSTFGGSGTIVVKGCKDQFCGMGQVRGSPQTINVSYLVTPLSASTSFVSLSANEGSTPDPQSITLNSSPGNPGWTSSVSYLSGAQGWLSVPPSGLSRPAAIALSPASLPAGVHKANIMFTASGASLTVPVVFMVHALGLNFVSPYVATTNVAGEVILRGYGFSSIANPEVMFDTSAATAMAVVSDTEIRASHPALAKGSYPVTVKNASQSLPTRAKLVVVDPPAYPFAAINRSGDLSKVIYDAERQALYLLTDNASNGKLLERYLFNGTGWTSDSVLIGSGGFGGMGLSPDGTEIIVAASGTVSHVDPNTLAVTASVSASPVLGPVGFPYDLAMANDGGAIGGFVAFGFGQGSKYYRYDTLLRDLVPLSTPADIGNRRIHPSRDGSRLIMAKNLPESTSDSLYYYDSGVGAIVLTPLTVLSARHVGVSRNASRVLIQKDYLAIGGAEKDRVYDDHFNLLGALPSGSDPVADSIAISPDGTKAYSYAHAGGVIRVFDLTQPDGLGGFTEITGTTVPTSASATEMTISPGGGTLFLGSAEHLLVIPAP